MSITWEYYSGRAGIGLKRFLDNNKDVKTYQDLCDTLKSRGVMPPPEEEFLKLQPVPKQTDIFKPKQKKTTRRPVGKSQSLGLKKKKPDPVKKDETKDS